MRTICIILLFLFGITTMKAQYFLGARSAFSDSFREWELILEKDSTEIEGDLELTWAIGNDFTQWRYDVDGLSGEIYQKFNNNPGLWELRAEDRLVTIKQIWPGDPSQWKITLGKRSFTIRTLYNNQLDEWVLGDDKLGELVVLTNRIGDPRDWIIEDYMVDIVTFEERMAAIFIAIYTSTPKY